MQTPNSIARDILVVALDPQSARLGPMLAKSNWQGALFVDFESLALSGTGPRSWADALEQRLPDLLIMVGAVGQDLSKANAIGAACLKAGLKISSILLAAVGTPTTKLSDALLQLRPWSHTLATLRDESYLYETLRALGA